MRPGGHVAQGRRGRRAARAAATLASVAVAVGLTACDRPHDPVAACRQADAQLSVGTAAAVIRVCQAAHDRTGDSDALVAVASAHLVLGHLDDVLAIARAAPDTPTSARLWHLAGDVAARRGDRPAARRWFERALDAQRDREPRRAANTAIALADLDLLDDQIEAALLHSNGAVQQAAASGRPTARMRASLALADLFLAVGDHRAAAATLDGVADLAGDATPFGRDYLFAVGDVEQRAGHPATAAAAYQRCLDAVEESPDPLVTVRCSLGLARVLIARASADDLARADRLLASAAALEPAVQASQNPDGDREGERALLAAELALARGHRDEAIASLIELSARPLGTGLRVRVATRLGVAQADAGRSDEAEVALQAAAAAVEQLRDGAHYEQTRRALPGELREPYEALFVLRAQRGNTPGAVVALERALTRDFIDRLSAAPAAGGRTIDQAVSDAIAATALRRTLDRRADDSPMVAAAASGSTVLAFFSARRRLWRIELAPGPDRPIEIADVGSLEELAGTIADAVGDPDGVAAGALAGRLLPSSALPAAEQALVIVPDPTLDGVRFAALPMGGGALIARHPLILAPTLRIATTPLATTSPAGAPVVLGDPTLDLAEARTEAAEVGALLGVRPLVGAAASRAALTAARRASVLHIASHGDRRSGESRLALADGDLTVADLLGIGLAPDLAVVASCVSAVQQRDAMWTSIAAGLLASGAGGVLGVSGRLPDAAGRELVTDFYRHGGAETPARALALTQRDAIRRGVAVEIWSMLVYLGSAEAPPRAAATAPAPRAGVLP